MKKSIIVGIATAGLIAGLVLAPLTNSFTVEGSHFRDKWLGSLLKLSFASVSVDIPLMKGYHNGEEVFFIATESSDKILTDLLTEKNDWKVVQAPLLSRSPESALSNVYMFINGGGGGQGTMGQQPDVFDNTPEQTDDYSPLRKIIRVTWSDESKAKELKSVDEIMAAEAAGDVMLREDPIVLNYPMIKWAGGQMPIREGPVTDDSKYGGGQVTNIDTETMKVTFIAHRGWGPDGKTIYYLVTDATPEGPAKGMGVVYAPKTENLAISPAAVDLFQFGNGIMGSGPKGFQAGIGAANPGEENYSPMWRISFINWNDPDQARILETLGDIKNVKDMISVEPAFEGMHVVNCPFIEV
ncbi:MAG: hypothetical protein ACE5KA_02180 [Nitrososphaerales archaeon]